MLGGMRPRTSQHCIFQVKALPGTGRSILPRTTTPPPSARRREANLTVASGKGCSRYGGQAKQSSIDWCVPCTMFSCSYTPPRLSTTRPSASCSSRCTAVEAHSGDGHWKSGVKVSAQVMPPFSRGMDGRTADTITIHDRIFPIWPTCSVPSLRLIHCLNELRSCHWYAKSLEKNGLAWQYSG